MTRVSIEPEKLTAIHVKNQKQCVMNQQCDNNDLFKIAFKKSWFSKDLLSLEKCNIYN